MPEISASPIKQYFECYILGKQLIQMNLSMGNAQKIVEEIFGRRASIMFKMLLYRQKLLSIT